MGDSDILCGWLLFIIIKHRYPISDTHSERSPRIKFNSAACSSKIPVYNNHYFGNGFMLSTASNKYLAASSAATDGNIIQARSTNALFKFTANGLLQSMNGSNTFYRVNPLVMIFRLTRGSSSSAYSYSLLYNPLGKSINWSRTGTGIFSITHNLNNTSHTVIGTASNYESHMVMYVTPYSTSANTDVIYTADDATRNDPQVLTLHFFDYNSYS